jgi:hypothetical protein
MNPLKKVNYESRTGICGGVGYAHTPTYTPPLEGSFFSGYKNKIGNLVIVKNGARWGIMPMRMGFIPHFYCDIYPGWMG